MTYLVVVEDDHLQEGVLEEELQRAFPGARIRTMCTESEFRAAIPGLRDDVPDVVIMDVMLRWAFPSPDGPVCPDDVLEDGFYRAGLRCTALLAEDDVLRGVPVVLLTILERSDLERTHLECPATAACLASSYVRKSADFHGLTTRVRELIA